MPDGINLLSSGIYTVSEAAALIGVSQRRIRGWIIGYSDSKKSPLIQNELGEFGQIKGRIAFSFANLMEMKFIKFFEDEGVKRSHIRSIFEEFRNTLKIPHPFATTEVYRTDGRKILEEIALKNKSIFLYDLKTKNYEMQPLIVDTLRRDVIYDARGIAMAWYPRKHLAPNVIIHPSLSFGRPILQESRIPTKTISDAVKVETKLRSVSEWFDIPEKQVRQAVIFEDALRNAA
jgi:uncharacterized protein (DUF433 family)/DNA-binding transcriptional MerR regulator